MAKEKKTGQIIASTFFVFKSRPINKKFKFYLSCKSKRMREIQNNKREQSEVCAFGEEDFD